MVKVLDDIGAEKVTGSARGMAPAFDIVGVGPEEVAHGSFVGYFLLSVNEADLVYRLYGGAETAVNTENSAGRGAK